MAHIPAGEYEMGDHFPFDRPGWPNNQWATVHLVYIDAFWMDKYEVTNEEYVEYLNKAYDQGLIEVTDGIVHKAGDTENYTNTSSVSTEWSPFVQLHWDGSEFTITQGWEDRPFVQVSWYGAAAFANWRSAEAGLTPCYDLESWKCDFGADGFRLPTEAEWEKASRGGHHDPYYMYSWGSNTTNNNEGNFVGSGNPYEREIPATTPVGYYDLANGYGLYDMAGNVWEWCNDWWDYDYPSESPYDNPRGPEKGVMHVNRGGGFHSRPSVNSRNATRCNGCHDLNNPASGNILGFNTGFRLVRSEATATSVADELGQLSRPSSFQLFQSYPNPFNPTTTIRFSLESAQDVRISVYDIGGQFVSELVNGYVTAGVHAVEFDANDLASGMYFYRITAGAFTQTRKMMLIR